MNVIRDVVAVAVLAWSLCRSCAQIVIDDFDQGAFFATATVESPGIPIHVAAPTANVIGGDRRVILNDFTSPSSTAELVAGEGFLDYIAGSNPWNIQLGYGSDGNSLGVDITQAGNNRFELTLSTGEAHGSLQFTVRDLDGGQAHHQMTDILGAGIYVFEFANLSGVNLQRVKEIHLVALFSGATPGAAYHFENFVAVHEPSFSNVVFSLVALLGVVLKWKVRRPA